MNILFKFLLRLLFSPIWLIMIIVTMPLCVFLIAIKSVTDTVNYQQGFDPDFSELKNFFYYWKF